MSGSGNSDGMNARPLRLFVEQAPVAMAMFDQDIRYI